MSYYTGMIQEQLINPEILSLSIENYFKALGLEKGNKLLLVADEPNGDQDVLQRKLYLNRLGTKLNQEGYEYLQVEFGKDPSGDELFNKTAQGLVRLRVNAKHGLVVVYMGDQWPNRAGLYNAVAKWSSDQGTHARMAGSLGMRVGEMELLAQYDQGVKERLGNRIAMGLDWLNQNPRGEFLLITTNDQNKDHQLRIPYDIDVAPMESDGVALPQAGQSILNRGASGEFTYGNLPTGEIYMAASDFKLVNGEMATSHGLKIRVKDGLLVALEGTNRDTRMTSVVQLVDAFKQGLRPGFAELGLGLLGVLGIEANPGRMDILGLEKYGIHIAFGSAVSPTPDDKVLEKIADFDNFHHSDVLAQNARLLWRPSTDAKSMNVPFMSSEV